MTLPRTDWELSAWIAACAYECLPLENPGQNSAWEIFYREYAEANEQERKRMDQVFYSFVDSAASTEPPLLEAAIYHLGRTLSPVEAFPWFQKLWANTINSRGQKPALEFHGLTLTARLLGALSTSADRANYEKIKTLIVQEAPSAGLLPNSVTWVFTQYEVDLDGLGALVRGVKPSKNLKGAIRTAGRNLRARPNTWKQTLPIIQGWPMLLQRAYLAGGKEAEKRLPKERL